MMTAKTVRIHKIQLKNINNVPAYKSIFTKKCYSILFLKNNKATFIRMIAIHTFFLIRAV